MRLARYDEARVAIEEEIDRVDAAGNQRAGAQGRLLLGRIHALTGRYDEAGATLDSAAAYLAGLSSTANRRLLSLITLTRIRILLGRGDGRAARAAIQAELDSLGYPAKSESPDLANTLRIAAEVALETGDGAAAERWATAFEEAVRRNARDPASSADVGQALLMRARARLMLNDRTGARGDLRAAIPALENGLGAGHPDTRMAREMLR
jgi:ATP/maltotriose-dependent transcriptional regulator MalT